MLQLMSPAWPRWWPRSRQDGKDELKRQCAGPSAMITHTLQHALDKWRIMNHAPEYHNSMSFPTLGVDHFLTLGVDHFFLDLFFFSLPLRLILVSFAFRFFAI
jgi:hypothetical protein